MQDRHQNRRQYFDELADTTEKYFIPYIEKAVSIQWENAHVLEIGCGEGGNLLPFARRGCEVCGVDMDALRIEQAKTYFKESQAKGTFIASDIFKLHELHHRFDLILIHDVIEHIADKRNFMEKTRQYLAPGGIIFVGFPAWQMPFGGHQQIAHNRIVSHMPFVHLLPRFLYKYVLQLAGESNAMIAYLIDVKETGTTVEMFQKIVKEVGYVIVDRRLYFVNPHYEIKFGLRPRVLSPLIAHIPWLRNFFSTTCFYLLRDGNE